MGSQKRKSCSNVAGDVATKCIMGVPLPVERSCKGILKFGLFEFFLFMCGDCHIASLR